MNNNDEIKVAQLASLTAGFTHYHHGEQSIGSVITTLAQNFIGTNNFNLLQPIGQFGSQLSPVPSAHRYIHTKLHQQNFYNFFHKDDDDILIHNYEDNIQIEPKFYLPSIPGILINPSEAIGTGFASIILPRNIYEIKSFIINYLQNPKQNKKTLLPYYNNYNPSLIQQDEQNPHKYIFNGEVNLNHKNYTITITQLPINVYLPDIINHLNSLINNNTITDYINNSTENNYHITIKLLKSSPILDYDNNQLLKLLKLQNVITENLTCWIPNISNYSESSLIKFDNIHELITHFINIRLHFYQLRLDNLIEKNNNNIKNTKDKIDFIEFYLNNTQLLKNSNKNQIVNILNNHNINPNMLDMNIWNLTKDYINSLHAKLISLNNIQQNLLNTNNTQLFINDLQSIT